MSSNYVIKPNEYIIFEPDQVLTNDHLNQLFGYLDQQERWTRNKLIGMGILCGLALTYKNDDNGTVSITIGKGCGVTSKGYLINKCTDDTYTQIIPYVPKPFPADLPVSCPPSAPAAILFYKNSYTALPKKPVYQLLTDAQGATKKPDPCAGCQPADTPPATPQNPPVPLTDLPGYVVVLFLEVQEKDLKNCDTQDCNNMGEKMIFNLMPLLVPVGLIEPKDGKKEEYIEIKLPRYNVPYHNLTNYTDVINVFGKIISGSLLQNIELNYNKCYDEFKGLLDISSNPFPFTATAGAYLKNICDSIFSQTSPINLPFFQYAYDFIDDLILAYYEFKEAATCVDVACCGDECAFPLHLKLGLANKTTGKYAKDTERQYFVKAADSCCEDNIAALQFYFTRMQILTTQFASAENFAQWEQQITSKFKHNLLPYPIRIMPSEYGRQPLSERAIPYYYLMDKDKNGNYLYEYWNFHKTAKGNAAFNLGYNAHLYNQDHLVLEPLNYDIEPYNFFRVEGHVGQQHDVVLADILELRKKYNLPFDVVAVSADMLGNNAKLPECQVQDLETDYRLAASEFLCKLLECICKFVRLPTRELKELNTHAAAAPTAPITDQAGSAAVTDDADDYFMKPESFTFVKGRYKLGDYIRFCRIDKTADTYGAAYLRAFVKDNFVSPSNPDNMIIGQTSDSYLIDSAIYEHINIVDRLFLYLLDGNISTFSISVFMEEYRLFELYQQRLIEYQSSESEYAKEVFVGLKVESCGCLDIVCSMEKMILLFEEYRRRIKLYEDQLYFLNYFKKHPGLEHKAGVPKGGTFVLVYHDGANIKKEVQAPVTKMNIKSVDIQEIELKRQDIEKILQFVNDCGTKNPVEKGDIWGIFEPNKPVNPTYNIPEGAVIADFYVPYMCCSDCPPVAYVVQPNPLPGNKPAVYTVTGGGGYCQNVQDPDLHIGLSGSTIGASYVLANADNTETVTLAGTGSALDFGAIAHAGTYTVVATDKATGLTNNMTGSATIVVNPPPAAITADLSQICVGKTAKLSSATAGGTWSSGSPTTATVDPVTGMVTGVAAGSVTITYTLTGTGCTAAKIITVNPLPAAVTGPSAVCVGKTITLTNATPGGTWSSTDNSAATVGAATGAVTGVAVGAATIIYTSAAGCTSSMDVTVAATPSSKIGDPVVKRQDDNEILTITLTAVETDAHYDYKWTVPQALDAYLNNYPAVLTERSITFTFLNKDIEAVLSKSKGSGLVVSLLASNGKCVNKESQNEIDMVPLLEKTV